MRRRRNSNFTYNNVPIIRKPRSAFPVRWGVKTTMPVGYLIPVDLKEVYPGDTFKISYDFVHRTTTGYVKPPLDNLFLDLHTFFVPLRLLYDKFKNVITGSNGDGEPEDWLNEYEGSIPSVSLPVVDDTSNFCGTLMDYFGLPIDNKIEGNPVSVLPFRAYARIYNEFYRDENIAHSTYIYKGDVGAGEYFNTDDFNEYNYFGKPAKVSKYKDYFTSVLPKPQKGNAVEIASDGALNPLITGAQDYTFNFGNNLRLYNGTVTPEYDDYIRPIGMNGVTVKTIGSTEVYDSYMNFGAIGTYGVGETLNYNNPDVTNLYAKIDNLGLDVNDLRLAFQLQKIKERAARSGNRYTEYLLSAWGVRSPDATLQRPEFLGGRHIPLGYKQVAQTSQSSSESPLGDVGAYGLSGGSAGYYKSFTEPGYVITLASIRYQHTYSQGVAKMWRRFKRFDFYDPTLCNIGEQPIKTTELYNGEDVDIEDVFGYQGAWDELRAFPSTVTGQMRPQANLNFSPYLYTDNYGNKPVLGRQFIEENEDNVWRAINVDKSSGVQPFMFDFYFHGVVYRVLPTYSVPSLIDHN